AEDGAGVLRIAVGRAEEKRDRHIERLGDPHQTACADPVHALFVFLDLLECDAEHLAKLGLRHALGHAPRPYALPHLDIVRIGALGSGFDTHSHTTPLATPNLCASGLSGAAAASDHRDSKFAHRGVARWAMGYWDGRKGYGRSALGGAGRRFFRSGSLTIIGMTSSAGRSPSKSRG